MTTHLHPDERSRLDDLRAALTHEFQVHTARLTQLTADTGDPGEAHNRQAMIAAARRSVQQVGDALRRIAEGRYGRCERCAGPIPTERLEVLPHARFCMPCQQQHAR
ncbi:TraR/DksA family transcriptional regulator [Micromonospora endolithica]|uniref:TraR/DksA family transcriptional regulator n=1 Tax=Micromonospora endolithica TaxID=230091 RepID=A0A3A9ZLK3_9ACTN|nr:TraR/DksA family transcriptional regulator [Micromonospora endolithica]RKN49178.1 TraR/DksA family transcriptional regulator [Micromonospora endolithica]TWJ23345.1 TraR/DksA family transcriptional regulator [Micromonospora endolithica]